MNIIIRLTLVLLLTLASTSVFAKPCDLSWYTNTSKKLDKSKIESVKNLAHLINTKGAKESDLCRSQLLSKFYTFYQEGQIAFDRINKISDLPYDEKPKINLEKRLSEVGWTLLSSEGMYYIGEQGDWFEKQFSGILPSDWSKYLEFRKKEIEEGFSEDAGLRISWEAIRQRIEFWESFLKKYPEFPMKDSIEAYLSIYFETFLTGMDNSPITKDFLKPDVSQDIIQTYERFLKNNRDSRYFNLVQGYYNVLKKNGFKVTKDLRKYLDENKIRGMHAIQPPTY